MNTRDNDPLHVAINATLAEVVTALPTPPAWYDGWMRLEPDTPEEERLRVYQAIRDSGCLPAEAGFYLVYWQIEDITCSEAETSLRELDVGMEAIEQAYELEHGEDGHRMRPRLSTRKWRRSTTPHGSGFSWRNSKRSGSTRWPSSSGPIPEAFDHGARPDGSISMGPTSPKRGLTIWLRPLPGS